MTWENYPSTATPRNATNLNKGIFGDTQYGGTISSNFNTITKNGYYTGYGTATGAPNTSYSWFVHHQNSNAGTASATQRAVAYTTGEPIIMERVKQSSTWGNWYNPLQSGWNYANETWTYASVDDPTGVITISGDKTGKYSLGMRIKFTNGGNVIYGIITKISYSSPNTTLTFLHEINPSTSKALHLIQNSAITNVYYSSAKAPFNFPISPLSWTVITSNSTQKNQSSPAEGTWYYTGVSANIPIGVWELSYDTFLMAARSVAGFCNPNITLSDTIAAPNAEFLNVYEYNSILQTGFISTSKANTISLTSKTTYYLNYRVVSSGHSNLYMNTVYGTTYIRAKCLYL